MSQFTLELYSVRSIKLVGETKSIKEELKTVGNWNPRLRNGPGWIFPLKKYGELCEILNNYGANMPDEMEEDRIVFRMDLSEE